MELKNPHLRSEPESELLEINAAALVEEMLLAHMPHDPPVDELDDPAPIPSAPCLVCEGTRVLPRYSVRGTPFRLVVCASCGLGTLEPKPTPRQIARFYPSEYYGSSGGKFLPIIEALVRWSAARSARMLTKDLPRGSRVLDVGCGRGVLFPTLADLGMETHGFEISPTAAQGADHRAEIRIASRLDQAGYDEESFDLIVLCHVLEHLPDPQGTLEEIHRILKPGGKLAVSVPNFSSLQAQWTGPAWFHLDLPRHLCHFPAEGLKQLLEQSGFHCVSEHHFSLSQNPFGWLQSLFNRWGIGPRNLLYSQLKRSDRPAKNNLTLGERLGWQAACWLGLPAALGMSLLCAAFRRGATITLVAERVPGQAPPTRGPLAAAQYVSH